MLAIEALPGEMGVEIEVAMGLAGLTPLIV
jgi:hypothetical protein